MYPEPLFYILDVLAYPYNLLQILDLILALTLTIALAREHGGIRLQDVFRAWFACSIAQLALTPVLPYYDPLSREQFQQRNIYPVWDLKCVGC